MPVVVNFNFNRNTGKAKDYNYIFKDTSDGDTKAIEMPVRMVSVDTPEKAGYAGKAALAQVKLNRCLVRLKNGFFGHIPPEILQYFEPKLSDPQAAERHILAAEEASQALKKLFDERLKRPDGKWRKLGTIPTGEVIDSNGRMLAYLTPWYSGAAGDEVPLRNDPRRKTFNLNMVENGWGAFFPVYPSLPDNADMNLAIRAAENAWNNSLGAWNGNRDTFLIAYEYRACVKLADPVATAKKGSKTQHFFTEAEFNEEQGNLAGWTITRKTPQQIFANALQRHCVDLRNLKVAGKYKFGSVPPPYRLWLWEKDLAAAIRDLALTPEN